MNDTAAEIQAELRRRFAATDASERLRMMSGMFSAAKSLAQATIDSLEDESDAPAAALFKRMYRTDFSASEIAAISEHLKAAHAR